jgi:endonuclease/exonuclease/phosphatase family metal-dependent hydrolase
MRSLTVSPGASVRAGQQIGEVGDLGNATGCHLHFEVHPRGGSIYQDSVDPTPWLREHVGRDTAEVAPASWSSGPQAFTLATFNVLGGSHTGGRGNEPRMAPGRVRIRGVVRLLEKYGVDVVGLQELQPPQRRAFATATAGRFVTWSPPRDTDNSLAWRRDRWDPVSTGVVPVPYFEGRPRLMPVVRLRDRVTGRESVFVNVHNPADTRDFPHQGHWRAVALAREVALVRRLRSTTGTPVFVTGDMNDHRTVFCRLTASGLTSASNGGSSRHGCHPPRRAGIDWIFGTADTGFSDHTEDRSALVRATSDHPFVVTRARVG